jgi:hypothetical protein
VTWRLDLQFCNKTTRVSNNKCSTRDRKFEAQGGDLEYCALARWSYARKGQNPSYVWQNDLEAATRCNKANQSRELNHNHGVIYVQEQIEGIW